MSGRAAYGLIADAARGAVTRLGCADICTIIPGEGRRAWAHRQSAARALRRSPNVVEVFPNVFARDDVAAGIRAVVDAAKVSL